MYYHRAIDYRIDAYGGLGREKFRLPVYPVVINILRPSPKTVRASPWADVFKQEGKQEGEQEGKQKEALQMLNILLQGRFGDVSESVQAALHLLRTDQLEELAKLFLLSNSLHEFIAHLARVRDEN